MKTIRIAGFWGRAWIDTSRERLSSAVAWTRGVLFFPVVLIVASALAGAANATTWYVDGSATGSNNGTSWANAWNSLNSVSGVQPGDTVYISGGPSGSSETYSQSTWSLPQGTTSSSITYQIGQDAAHNGTAIFNGGNSGNSWINGPIVGTTILGDAGDGNMHFAVINFNGSSLIMSSGAVQNVRIGYVNFGTQVGQIEFGSYGSTGPMEFDHCYYYLVPNTGISISSFLVIADCAGSGYDFVKFHDNTIYVPIPYGAGGYGLQAFNVGGTGFSLYNNQVVEYVTNASLFSSYESTTHQDSFIALNSTDTKIYNNTFINANNIGVFLDVIYQASHIRIYNNIIYDSIPLLGSPRGFSAVNDSGTQSGATCSDVVFANNLIANFNYINNVPSGYSFSGSFQGFGMDFGNQVSGPTVAFSGNLVANNLLINSSDIGDNATVEDDVEIDGANTGNFVNYAQLSGNYLNYVNSGGQTGINMNNTFDDFHLRSTATAIRGQGANLSTYFGTDKDGNSRPASGAWDLGPYQYGSAPAEGLSISAIGVAGTNVDQNAGKMYPGTYTLTATAVETGANAVTNAWTHAINGGATVLDTAATGTSLSESFTIPAGNVGSTYVIKAIAGDGVTNVNSQLSFTVESAPAPTSVLNFAAASGTLTSPMTAVTGGSTTYIEQAVSTGISGAGTAAYQFTITNAGNYEVQFLVDVTNTSNDSIFLSIDAAPVSPTDICDFRVTSGFQNELADWRGTGSDGSEQYSPVSFALTTGGHTLTVTGRDAYVPIEDITLIYLNTNATYTPPTVSAVTQSGTDVDPSTPGIQAYEGTEEGYSATGAVYNGATMSWQWSYTINGGAPVVYQSGTGTVPPVTYNYPGTSGGNNYVWTITVSDGVSNAVSQLAVGVEVPPPPTQGLTFLATNGVLTPPMVATNGYIYQPTYTSPETDPAAGGSAVFTFSITNAGSYVIQAQVNAPSDSQNSFWVNIDSMPVDPTDVWDCGITTNGFQQELVTWRGNGTDTSPQYVPQVWTLSAGTHTLYFVGRESDTELESFSILKVPSAPSGFHVL
jgi:hypothetical protein